MNWPSWLPDDPEDEPARVFVIANLILWPIVIIAAVWSVSS